MTQDLARKAAAAIDTSRRYSLHWERRSGGSLTYNGLVQAISDCRARIAECRDDLNRLREVGRMLIDRKWHEEIWGSELEDELAPQKGEE